MSQNISRPKTIRGLRFGFLRSFVAEFWEPARGYVSCGQSIFAKTEVHLYTWPAIMLQRNFLIFKELYSIEF